MGNNLNCLNRNENIDKILSRKYEISSNDYFNNKNIYNNKNNFYLEFNNNKSNYFNDSDYNILNKSRESKPYICNMKDLNRTQIMKIRKIIENFNQNGKPRPSDDFNSNNWTNFYQKNSNFFLNDNNKTEVCHNQLVIYNPNNINKITIYQGDLNREGKRQGIGKYTTPFYVLIGMWKNDKFTGWGRESRCNGDVFEGRFINGIINGKGIFIDKNKNKYIGDFINMKRWGKGKWSTNNIIYEGEFYNNKIHGKGKIKFIKSGIEYIGTFKNDQIDGYGTFKWVNGDIYEGEVKNGKMDGKGKYKYSNGKTISGLFNNGIIKEIKSNFSTEKIEGKKASINNLNYGKPFLKNREDKFTFDDRKAYMKNNMINNVNKRNKIGLYKNIPEKNFAIEININNNKEKFNSLKTINNKGNYNINIYNKNNFTKKNPYEPIQQIPEYKINNSEKTSDFKFIKNENNVEDNLKINELIILNDSKENDKLDYEKISTIYDRILLEEIKNMKIEGFETISNDINNNANYNVFNEENNSIQEFIDHQNKIKMEDLMTNNKSNLTNRDIKREENIQDKVQIQKNEPNPNILLSTYRNFGFGDNN